MQFSRLLTLLLFVLIFQQPQRLLAQVQTSSTSLDAMIDSTITYTYNYKFADAVKTTDKIARAFPSDPAGYLYKCGVYWKMLEEGCFLSNDSTMVELRTLIDKACAMSIQRIDDHEDDVMAHFYYAGSLVYRARCEAMNHDWFAVMSDGTKTRKELEKSIAIDPNFCDAYSGIGAFDYYAARIPWYLKPIALVLGIRGNEAEGIAQLKRAAESGRYAKTEAAVFLASVVYVNQEDYSEAVKIMLELHRQYPGNLDFVRNLCRDYYEQERYMEVVRLANSALDVKSSDNACHEKSLSFIRFYRGQAFEKLNERNKAVADYEIVVRQEGNSYPGKEAKEELEKLRIQ